LRMEDEMALIVKILIAYGIILLLLIMFIIVGTSKGTPKQDKEETPQ